MALPIITDDPNAAPANRAALEAATGYTPLPPGTVYTSGPVRLDADNNGTTLTGPATTIACTETLGGQSARAALLAPTVALSSRGAEKPKARGAVLPPGQIGWWFDGNDNQATGGTVTRILPGQEIPQTLEFIRAFRAVPFFRGQTEFSMLPGHGIGVGEDLLATDGPTINEVVAEFRRVVAATPLTITLDRPLTRTYRQGSFVRGPFAARQRFNGLTLSGQLGTVLLFNALDIAFTDCLIHKPPSFPQGDPNNRFSIMGCGRIELRRCDLRQIDGIGLSHGHDVRIVDCDGNGIIGEQNQDSVTVERSRFAWLDAWQQCRKWTIRDCDFAGGTEQTLGIYDDWIVDDVRCSGTVRVRGQGAIVTRLRTNGRIVVTPDYPARHSGSATNVTLVNCECEAIELWPGSSGRIVGCSGHIVGRPADKANWLRDGRPIP